MDNKVILITGASDGIGKETAKALAKQGHTIIMHGRNPQKTKSAYEEVKTKSGNNNIEYLVADFLSLAEIKRFADNIKQKYDRLDVLVTILLLPLLKKSPSARVVTVASAAHKMAGKPTLTDIELKNNYSMGKAYGLSKLYVIWIMRHFVSEMAKAGISNITFNTVHPASATSSLGRESTKSLTTKIIYFLWRPLMKTAAEGAASSIYAATSPDLEGITGKYYGLKGEEKPSDKFYSPKNEQIVWDYSMNIIKPYL